MNVTPIISDIITESPLIYNGPSCVQPAIDSFPNGIFSQDQLSQGGFILPLLFSIYVIGFLGIVCDEYFVPVLEYMRIGFKITPHIAGATLMAIGTSSPEFFTNVMGTFVTQNNLGIGTILGSALFNIFGIVAICGFAGPKAGIPLEIYPVTRDTVAYGISILSLVLVLVDGIVTWYESLILLSLYAVYILILIFDSRIQNLIYTLTSYEGVNENTSLLSTFVDDEVGIELFHPYPWSGIFYERDGVLNTVIRVLYLPARLLLFVTIPNMNILDESISRYLFPIAFISSTIWTGILTYLLSWMVTIVVYTVGIPDSVAGLTLIAAGTSVPELASSIIIVRKNSIGAMAISNLIGSNTFDILVCLGLPWLIQSAINGSAGLSAGSDGLGVAATTLFISLGAIYFIISWNGFRVTKGAAWASLFIYFIVLLITILMEFNIFYEVNPPTCTDR